MKFPIIGSAMLALASALAPAVARADTAPAPQAIAPPIDPKALDLLRQMADTLAHAKSLSFSVRRAFDEPAANGQPLLYMVASDIVLQRPDRLKIITLGDGPASEFYYDGKEMAVFLPGRTPRESLVAIETAPPKLEDLLEAAYTKAGIYFPYVDLIVDDPYTAITEKLTSAFVMGQSTVVANTKTNIVAIANSDFQAQIWIGANDRLPRLVWMNPTGAAHRPRSMMEFSNWKIGVATTAKTFHSTEAWSAARIKFAKPGTHAPAK